MAKSISIRPSQPVAAAQFTAGQQVATAQAFNVPPAAGLPPGVIGTMPLPAGKPVKLMDPARLLPAERKLLRQIGWVEGQPIPQDMAPAIQKIAKEIKDEMAQAKLMPTIDPSTPPLQVNTIPIEQLPPEQQAKYAGILKDAMDEISTQAQQAAATEALTNPPEWQKNMQFVDTAPSQPQAAPPKPAGNPKARQQAAGELTSPPTPQEAAAMNRTESPLAPLTNCPHCRWDLSLPDEPEPPLDEKQAFLQAILGEIPFVKEYHLLGGALTVVFRTLATREIDACFDQCFSEKSTRKITNDMDFFERLNRHRLHLQLQRMRSDQFDHDLPDGLDVTRNPNATAYWETDQNARPLEQIEEYMLKNVLKNESIVRIMQQQCNRFNRLVARLEALTANTDFWKPTVAAP